MTTFWRELRVASDAVESTVIENAIESFKLENNRNPNDDEIFFIKAFVNNHILQSQ